MNAKTYSAADTDSTSKIALAAIAIFLLALFAVLALGASAPEIFCSAISLIWLIFVTVWICKIKNRSAHSAELLEKILSELKKQNV